LLVQDIINHYPPLYEDEPATKAQDVVKALL